MGEIQLIFNILFILDRTIKHPNEYDKFNLGGDRMLLCSIGN